MTPPVSPTPRNEGDNISNRELGHENRLATVEANVLDIKDGIREIKQYLTKRSDQHLEVMQKLAVITSRQEDTLNYQELCDKDRNDHDKRLNGLETSEKMDKAVEARTLALATCLGGTVVFFTTTFFEWIKR